MAVTELDARRRQQSAAISAAAIRLDDAGAKGELGRQLQRFEKWQEEAINFTRVIGEIRYAIDYDANQLARCPLYVAARPDASSALIPADDDESGIAPELATRANEVLRTLQAPIGGQAQIVYAAETNTRVAGEWWLLNYRGPNEAMHGWHVRSSLDMNITNSKIESKGLGEFAPEDVSRVWQPDPFMFDKATSGMRAVLSQCELVLRCDRQFEAALTSRLFAGLLLLSNGFRGNGMVPETAETAGDGEAQLDPVIVDVMTAFATSIQSPGTAAANVPNTLWGDRDDIKDGARLLSFQQQIDPAVMDLREKCLRRIAQGLDLPPEIVLGIADVNHWSAWAIGEEAVQLAEPKAAFLADAFTTVFLRPELEAEGYPLDVVDRLEVAFDLAPLRKRPNAAEDAKYAYEKGEVSGVGLRRVLQIPESDAPDEAETEDWLLRNKATIGPNLTTELLRRTVSPDLPDITDAAKPGQPSDAPVDAPADGPPPIPAAASTAPSARNRLSAIDISLTERLFAAALAAFRTALDKAGNKAKAKVASAHRSSVKDVPSAQVVATLGPTLMAAAGLDEEALLVGALVGLRADFDRWVAAAQADALDAAIAMAGADPDESQIDEFAAAQAQDREDAWEWFEGAATALLVERMASGKGLADWEVRDLVRRSLARAGGADELAPFEPGEVPADGYGTGLATGPLLLGVLAGFGVGVTSWEWEHGEPAHPFPEHSELHGDRASTEDGFGGYTPGDHAGCTCVVVPIFGGDEE